MSAEGWLKLWRKLEESDVWELPPTTTRIWLWLLMHACHEPRTVYGVSLEPGELATSANSIAQGVAWKDNGERKMPTDKAVRWALKTLSARQAVEYEPRQRVTWIKVLHWEDYQATDNGYQGTDHGTNYNTTTAEPRHQTRIKKEEVYTGPCKEVFEHWKIVMGKDRSRFTAEKQRHIEARLREGFSVEDLKQVATNAAADPWTMGDNDRNKAFNEIDNLYRNATRVEKFLEAKGRQTGLELVMAMYE